MAFHTFNKSLGLGAAAMALYDSIILSDATRLNCLGCSIFKQTCCSPPKPGPVVSRQWNHGYIYVDKNSGNGKIVFRDGSSVDIEYEAVEEKSTITKEQVKVKLGKLLDSRSVNTGFEDTGASFADKEMIITGTLMINKRTNKYEINWDNSKEWPGTAWPDKNMVWMSGCPRVTKSDFQYFNFCDDNYEQTLIDKYKLESAPNTAASATHSLPSSNKEFLKIFRSIKSKLCSSDQALKKGPLEDAWNSEVKKTEEKFLLSILNNLIIDVHENKSEGMNYFILTKGFNGTDNNDISVGISILGLGSLDGVFYKKFYAPFDKKNNINSKNKFNILTSSFLMHLPQYPDSEIKAQRKLMQSQNDRQISLENDPGFLKGGYYYTTDEDRPDREPDFWAHYTEYFDKIGIEDYDTITLLPGKYNRDSIKDIDARWIVEQTVQEKIAAASNSGDVFNLQEYKIDEIEGITWQNYSPSLHFDLKRKYETADTTPPVFENMHLIEAVLDSKPAHQREKIEITNSGFNRYNLSAPNFKGAINSNHQQLLSKKTFESYYFDPSEAAPAFSYYMKDIFDIIAEPEFKLMEENVVESSSESLSDLIEEEASAPSNGMICGFNFSLSDLFSNKSSVLDLCRPVSSVTVKPQPTAKLGRGERHEASISYPSKKKETILKEILEETMDSISDSNQCRYIYLSYATPRAAYQDVMYSTGLLNESKDYSKTSSHLGHHSQVLEVCKHETKAAKGEIQINYTIQVSEIELPDLVTLGSAAIITEDNLDPVFKFSKMKSDLAHPPRIRLAYQMKYASLKDYLSGIPQMEYSFDKIDAVFVLPGKYDMVETQRALQNLNHRHNTSNNYQFRIQEIDDRMRLYIDENNNTVSDSLKKALKKFVTNVEDSINKTHHVSYFHKNTHINLLFFDHGKFVQTAKTLYESDPDFSSLDKDHDMTKLKEIADFIFGPTDNKSHTPNLFTLYTNCRSYAAEYLLTVLTTSDNEKIRAESEKKLDDFVSKSKEYESKVLEHYRVNLEDPDRNTSKSKYRMQPISGIIDEVEAELLSELQK